MEPTPIFAALAAPSSGGPADLAAHDGHGEQRRTVPELLRVLRAEQEAAPPIGRVGHVPGVLSFRPRG